VRVVVVSGIWPPDVGGPASHAPALAAVLLEAGHTVEVVTTADARPEPRPYRVRWVSRSRAAVPRHLGVVRAVARAARGADRVYATSMVRRAALGAALARRPLVVKLVSDEAFERTARAGRYAGTLEDFQSQRGPRVRLLRATRNAALRRAAQVVVPSAYLRDLAVGWGVRSERLTVVPNPAPPVRTVPGRAEARSALGIDGFTLAAAGRLTRQKALTDALAAVAAVGDGVSLLVAGDGPERAGLERRAADLRVTGRVRFLGPLSRDEVLKLLRAADAGLLTSAWENLPHSILETLAVGTPVVATAVGGVPEVVRDGENGLLVPPGDVPAIAAAIRRLADDETLRGALASRAAASVAELDERRLLERIVGVIEDAGW
jgi:glycosyltransferase involved in cell wall biosynthesis